MNQQPQDFPVTITLMATQLNLILAALQELPAKICNPLSQNLIEQAGPQTPQPPMEEVPNTAANEEINDDPEVEVATPAPRPAPKIIKPRTTAK